MTVAAAISARTRTQKSRGERDFHRVCTADGAVDEEGSVHDVGVGVGVGGNVAAAGEGEGEESANREANDASDSWVKRR